MRLEVTEDLLAGQSRAKIGREVGGGALGQSLWIRLVAAGDPMRRPSAKTARADRGCSADWGACRAVAWTSLGTGMDRADCWP